MEDCQLHGDLELSARAWNLLRGWLVGACRYPGQNNKLSRHGVGFAEEEVVWANSYVSRRLRLFHGDCIWCKNISVCMNSLLTLFWTWFGWSVKCNGIYGDAQGNLTRADFEVQSSGFSCFLLVRFSSVGIQSGDFRNGCGKHCSSQDAVICDMLVICLSYLFLTMHWDARIDVHFVQAAMRTQLKRYVQRQVAKQQFLCQVSGQAHASAMLLSMKLLHMDILSGSKSSRDPEDPTALRSPNSLATSYKT